MARQRTTFDKLQRERAKKAKQAAKRERRQSKGRDDEVTQAPTPDADKKLSAPQLLDAIEQLQRRFEAGLVEADDFEEQRLELFEQLAALDA